MTSINRPHRTVTIHGDVPDVAGDRKNEPFGTVTPQIACVEGLIEAIVALDDDQRLFRQCRGALQIIDLRSQYNLEALERGTIDQAGFDRNEADLRRYERHVWRLMHMRANRLRDHIIPEAKRCATLADRAA